MSVFSSQIDSPSFITGNWNGRCFVGLYKYLHSSEVWNWVVTTGNELWPRAHNNPISGLEKQTLMPFLSSPSSVGFPPVSLAVWSGHLRQGWVTADNPASQPSVARMADPAMSRHHNAAREEKEKKVGNKNAGGKIECRKIKSGQDTGGTGRMTDRYNRYNRLM